jgi:hypothetical protein
MKNQRTSTSVHVPQVVPSSSSVDQTSPVCNPLDGIGFKVCYSDKMPMGVALGPCTIEAAWLSAR